MRALGIALLLLGIAAPARAESFVPACTYTTPDAEPPAGTIPASTPLFTLPFFGTMWDPSEATLVRTSDAHSVPLAAWTHVNARLATSFAPLEPLTVGEAYVFTHPRCGFGSPTPQTTLYQIADPDPIPTSAGTITTRGPFAAHRARGACFRYVFVQVDLDPDPTFASAPWSSFTWSAELDGAWASPYSVPMAERSLALEIDCARGPRPLRAVVMPVQVASSQQSIEPTPLFSSSTLTLDVDCASAIEVDAATLTPLTPEEIAYQNVECPDAWTPPPMDAGSADAGSVDAGPLDASVDAARHTEPDTHPNCTCSAPGGPRRPTPLVLVIAVGAWMMNRSRRTRRSARAEARSRVI